MKLELKHLAPYLPYGLKVKTEYQGNFNCDPNYIKIEEWNFSDLEKPFKKRYKMVYCKPILCPLSDLTEEIEVNGEKFVPCDKLIELTNYGSTYKGQIFWEHKALTKQTECIVFKSKVCKEFVIDLKNTKWNQYSIMQKLFEWHFDVFGLIEKGLAIDMNTIN